MTTHPHPLILRRGPALLLLVLTLLGTGAHAQSLREVRQFFEACQRAGRQGTPLPAAPEGHIISSQREADEVAATYWRLWRMSVRAAEPELSDSLLSVPLGREALWALPSRLEPMAVMPLAYGYKDSVSAGGNPLFIYLHGSGPKAQEWATGKVLARRFDDSPSTYVVPQIPNEGPWYRWWQQSKQTAWTRLLRVALSDEGIDPLRIHMTGISEGGYGSQRLASFYADYLAGAGPMAAGEPLRNAPAENLQHVRFSLLTGQLDAGFYRNHLTRCVKRSLDSLRNLCPGAYEHRVELQRERGHGIDYRPTTPWLVSARRTPLPKAFTWEDFEMDGLHRTGFYCLIVDRRPDQTLRTRYDVRIEDNVVDLQIRNIQYRPTEVDPVWGIELQSERTYSPAEGGRISVMLGQELVDLSREVVVRVNGQQRYHGHVTLETGSLLRSIAAFADPLRLLPACVTTDF